MTLYLDASVIVPLIVPEPSSEALAHWFAASHEPICVGRLAIGETVSAISRRRRMAHLTDEQGEIALARLDEWVAATDIVEHEPGDVVEAAQLVRRPVPKLLMPDAIHLATCRRLGHRLVTADTPDTGLALVADLLGIGFIVPG